MSIPMSYVHTFTGCSHLQNHDHGTGNNIRGKRATRSHSNAIPAFDPKRNGMGLQSTDAAIPYI